MSIADKLLWLGGTKNLLRGAINAAGGSIGPDAPFRDYASWIGMDSEQIEIRKLYDGNVAGFFGDARQPMADTSALTPATYGDPVAYMRDRSGNGHPATEATLTARPIFGRVPKGGWRNLWVPSVDLNEATKGGAIVYQDGEADEYIMEATSSDGYSQFYQIFSTGRRLLFAIDVKWEGTVEEVSLSWNGAGVSVFNIKDGVVVSGGGQIESQEGGWYRVAINVSRGASNAQAILLRLEGQAVGDTIRVRRPQVELAEVGQLPTPYQETISQYNITEAGIQDVPYLRFDLVDDKLTQTLPAISNGTLVISGINGTWIDEDFSFTGGEFTVGPSTYTGGPAGLLPLLGDLAGFGWLVIDRQLTASERESVIRYCKNAGAGDLIP